KHITLVKHPTNIKSAEIIFHLNSCAKFNLVFKSDISNHVTASFTCDPTEGECVIGYFIETSLFTDKNKTDRTDQIKFDAIKFFARDLCVFRLFRKLKPSNAYKILIIEHHQDKELGFPSLLFWPRSLRFR
uniref:Uncharacterized protein n=1 Tax=Romanomermis culicivorax TaxID=13658 RepID=A0A915I1A9_ROMCU